MLKISKLTASYNKQDLILDGLDLWIEENQIVGILGENGSGKTTLINCLAGVHKEMNIGKCMLNEQIISLTDNDFKYYRFIVHTESNAFSYWTFDNYLKFICKTYKCKMNQSLLEYLVNGFNFKKYRKTKIVDLSTGNKKKCFLITALIMRLPLLILDEPFDGLDYTSSEFLIEQINEYRKYGSIFMSSHIAETFSRTCDVITVLNNKQLTYSKLDNDTDIRAIMSDYVH